MYRAMNGWPLAWTSVLLLALATTASAQSESGSPVTAEVGVSQTTLHAGDSFVVRISIQIEDGFHIERVADPLTRIRFANARGIDFGDPIAPPARAIEVEYQEDEAAGYTGRVTLYVPARVAANARTRSVEVRATVRYRANSVDSRGETASVTGTATVNVVAATEVIAPSADGLPGTQSNTAVLAVAGMT